jgi:membrane protease subunit HflC
VEAISSFDEESTEDLRGTGVEIVDVRLNRIELPRAAEPAAYSQMREQRRALSREHRAVGERRAREVRASADRQARLVLATAEAKAELVRGEGDAESARIYADAYSRDPEFFAFLRSLEAYREVLRERTTMVLPPDHAFFRFLDPAARGSSAGRARPAASAGR